LANVLARLFIFVVDGVEEGHITWQKNGVRLAVMEKQRLLRGILGELKPLIEKEYAEYLYKYIETKIS
jgi:hypothetical protein